MRNDLSQDPDKSKSTDIRKAAKRAVAQILEPLAAFVLDSGLSANELQAIFREAAVRSAAAKQLEKSYRVNISGIAASTGIARADISRILKVSPGAKERETDAQPQSTNRILAAWHSDPKFTSPDGQPAVLKIYGRGATFEKLARQYGRGIPSRAVLDELVRAGAVELIEGQKIRAKAAIAVERGLSARVVKAFGERASELLATMLRNMRQPDVPRFVANFTDSSISAELLPLFRKELSDRGADFLADVQESLKRKTAARTSKPTSKGLARVSVTIFYHESIEENIMTSRVVTTRRNFRRES